MSGFFQVASFADASGALWPNDASTAETAASGYEALAAMRRHAAENRPYQAAIVDSEMPGSDAPALARAIRSDPALAKTRLLSMSPVGKSATCAAAAAKISTVATAKISTDG